MDESGLEVPNFDTKDIWAKNLQSNFEKLSENPENEQKALGDLLEYIEDRKGRDQVPNPFTENEKLRKVLEANTAVIKTLAD